jgi:hypothetical protein
MKSIKTNPNSAKGPDKGKGGFSKLCVKRKKKILYRPTPFFNT